MKVRKVPMRQCTVCREMKNKKELIRVIKTPEGEIVVDTTGKQNGRGAYLCHHSECIDKALATRSLEKSLKCKIPEEIYEQLKEGMSK